MKYTMIAHPTGYAGVTFRSRLEAKWAAYFDLSGIKWRYEPVDLPGWSPDFSVFVKGQWLFAEVKPLELPVQFDLEKMKVGGPRILLIGIRASWIWNYALGDDDGCFRCPEIEESALDSNRWREAANLVQWKPRTEQRDDSYITTRHATRDASSGFARKIKQTRD